MRHRYRNLDRPGRGAFACDDSKAIAEREMEVVRRHCGGVKESDDYEGLLYST